MGPGEQTELFHVVFFDQRQNKPHETNAVQRKRQKTMIGDQEAKIFQTIDDDTKVIDQIFTIEEIVGETIRTI